MEKNIAMKIKPFLKDPDMEEYSIGNFKFLNKHESLYRERIALYNIYDGTLTPEYGASGYLRYHFINYLMEEKLEDKLLDFNFKNESNTVYIEPLYISFDDITHASDRFNDMSLCGYLYFQSVKKIYSFLNDVNYKTAIICLGMDSHATMLYIKKINNTIVLTYINTGMGLDLRLLEHKAINEEEYYDLYQARTFNNNNINEIITFIKPLIFATCNSLIKKNLEINVKQLYDYCMEQIFIDGQEDKLSKLKLNNPEILYNGTNSSTLEEWYAYCFNKITQNNESIYDYLKIFFNTNKDTLPPYKQSRLNEFIRLYSDSMTVEKLMVEKKISCGR